MKVELLRCDDPAWSAFLAAAPHDFYHLPAYVALEAEREGGEGAALHVADGDRAVLLPLILRPIPGGPRDAISPYGFPGPLLRGSDDRAFIGDALTAALPTLRSEGIVTVFVRSHPLLDDPPPDRPGTLVYHGDTVAIDATLSDEEQWRNTRGDHRNHINRALRLGYRVVIDDECRYLPDFERLYVATMDRVAARDFYRFDTAYFGGLRAALGPHLKVVAALTGDLVAAAALIVETSGIVEYHLAANDALFMRDGAAKLMVHVVRAWAGERGDRFVHMGGGVGAADDPLLYFKVGFSPLRFRFHTLRIVADEPEYERLVRAADPAADPTDRSGFFPAYRGSTTTEGAADGSPRSGATDR